MPKIPSPPNPRPLRLTNAAAKTLKKLIRTEPKMAQAIAAQIQQLRTNPTPPNSKKITNYPCHRVRVSSYRIIYEFDDEQLLVTLIARRAHIYQKMTHTYR